MAERRMFAKTIISSDAFLDMPITSRLLYFYLMAGADDDGFVNNPKSIIRTVGCSQDDMNVLISKKFVLVFEDGVIVIKHWRIHNYIQSDRYIPTKYKDHKAALELDGNKSYRLPVSFSDTGCIQDVSNVDTQVRDRDRVRVRDRVRDRVTGGLGGADAPPTPPPKKTEHHKFGSYQNVLLSDSDMDKLKTEFPSDWESRIERLSSYIASTGKAYKNHLATIRNWARMDKERTAQNGPKQNANFHTEEKPVDSMELRAIREMLGGNT